MLAPGACDSDAYRSSADLTKRRGPEHWQLLQMPLVCDTKALGSTAAHYDPNQRDGRESCDQARADVHGRREEPNADRQQEQQVKCQGSGDALSASLVLHELCEAVIS